jgi:hypothetical protein
MKALLKRHLPVVLLVASLFALGVYTLYWYAQMRKFQRDIAIMQSATGGMFDIESSTVTYSGFPYRLKAAFEAIELVRQRSDYIVTLQAPRLELTRLMWQPDHMIMTVNRPVIDMRSRGGSRPLKCSFSADSLESSLRITPKKVERLSFEFRNAIWSDGHTLNLPIKIADLQLHIRESDVPSVDAKPDKKHPVIANFRLMAGGLHSGKAEPMNVDLYADLTGNTPFGDNTPMFDIWRQKSGTVALRRFNIVRPELSWSATGQLRLDKNGLVIGDGKLSTNSIDQTLALLKGQILSDPITAPIKDHDWKIIDGTLQLDAKLAATVPFQLFDVVVP